MSDSTSRSDGLCDRCSRFLHFKGGKHGFYAETTDDDGTAYIDFDHTRNGKRITELKSQFPLEDDYPAMTKLKRTASKGCGFCHLLVKSIEEQAPKVEEIMVLLINNVWIIRRPNTDDFFYNAGVLLNWEVFDSKTKDGPSQRWSGKTYFRLLANKGTMAAKYLKLLYAPIHPSRFCSETLAYIQRNLSNCSENHQKCVLNRPKGHLKHQALPSRLLHIRKDQTGYRIRLVQTQPRTSSKLRTLHPKYAALSYCWGDQEFIKSTPENITDHYNNIAFSKLPPGFQDTIEMCWGIGFFFLWIDSLCIIQGDQSDWDRESALMKDVYANAFLTIILASTGSPLEGLSNVSTECCSDVRVSYHLDDDNGSEITYFIQSASSTKQTLYSSDLEFYPSGVEYYYEGDVHKSEWIKRGWTFQESYLSTRKLLICSGHTDFSCKTSSSLQGILRICWPLKDVGYYVSRSRPRDWYDLVGHYSDRKLSRSEDKLPAISAVASLVREGHGDYVAGLWTKSLERGLLWAPGAYEGSRRALKRQTTYRGPTWSWCAYDGSLSYDMVGFHENLTRAFDILEIRWTLAEPSAIYGRLSTADGDRAYLMIRAKVAWVTIQSEERVASGVDAVMECRGMQRRGREGSSTFLIDCGKTEGFESLQRVAAMLVATMSSYYSIKDLEFGLFLRPIPSLGPVITYERVGCFRDWNELDMFKHGTQVQELRLV